MGEGGMFVRIGKDGQVRLPTSLLREAGINEGDILAVRLEGGLIILSPAGLTESSQAYFWTEKWQQGEKQAETDIREDRVQSFETVEDLVNWLDKPHDRFHNPF